MRTHDSLRKACLSLLALLALLALSVPAHAKDPAPTDKWTFAIRPYLWAPGITGTVKYDVPPSGGGGANVDFSSYILENLNIALMLSAEARKGDWSVLTDVVYLDVESGNSEVKSVTFTGPGGRIEFPVTADLGTKATLSGVLWELAGAYTVARGGNSSLDVLAGFRLLDLKAGTDLNATFVDNTGASIALSRNVSQTITLWDGIVGVRGAVGLGSGKWAIPYYLDVGTGSSTITWQGMAGIEYRFSWVDLQLVYRYLYYDMKSDKMLQSVSFHGPAIGVNFRF